MFILNNDSAVVDEPELEQAIFTQLESEINIIKLLNNSKKLMKINILQILMMLDYLIKIQNKINQNYKR